MRLKLVSALAVLASLIVLGSPAAATPFSKIGKWTEPFDIGQRGIHAVLLHTNEVLLFSYPDNEVGHEGDTRAALLNWRDRTTTEVPISYERDLFCAGHTVLADGRVYVVGGHDHSTGAPGDGIGSEQTDIFDPSTQDWTASQPLAEKRWYPTPVEMPDGRVYIFGGQYDNHTFANTVEVYDPATGDLETEPDSATRWVGNYPFMWLMPNGKILRAGPRRFTQYFDPVTSTWENVGRMRELDRQKSTGVLLPGNNSVMLIGGRNAVSGDALATTERLKTDSTNPRWKFAAPMHYPRMNPNGVVLPNGKVLVVGGGSHGNFEGPVLTPEVYDPDNNTWQEMAPQTAPRMYHSTAVLLPDGRVLSTGQNSGDYQTTAEIFSPPYLFRGSRPVIEESEDELTYGNSFTVETSQAADIAKASLMRPASVTHGFDSQQRYVPLTYTVKENKLTLTAPSNPNAAPPGWYMLFIVGKYRVPSEAVWVHLS